MADFSHDSDLPLEGLLESAAKWYIESCAVLPEAVTVWTEHGGDDSGPDDAGEEERGTPCVVVSATLEEEQMTDSGIYEVALRAELRATDGQLTKRDFAVAFREVRGALKEGRLNDFETDSERLYCFNVEGMAGEDMEYEDAVRVQAVTATVFATAESTNIPAYLATQGGAFLTTQGGLYME